jgi:hypothetical protein
MGVSIKTTDVFLLHDVGEFAIQNPALLLSPSILLKILCLHLYHQQESTAAADYFSNLLYGWITVSSSPQSLWAKDRRHVLDSTLLTCALDFPKSCKHVLTSLPIPTLMIPKLAQTSVALINLTHSVHGGTNWNDTYTRDGMVNAPNLACYFHNESYPVVHTEEVSQASAHAYGELALSTDCGPYNETSDILNSRYDYRYYCRRTAGRQEFAHRFSEYNPKDVQETYTRFTNRIVTSSAVHVTSTPRSAFHQDWIQMEI